MRIWTTPYYDSLSWSDIASIANGCGPETCRLCARFLDNAMGLRVFEACGQHDVDYEVGGTRKDKMEADIRFICNLIIIALSHPSLLNVIRIPYLFIYYLAVHWSGHEHFNYHTNTLGNTAGVDAGSSAGSGAIKSGDGSSDPNATQA